MWGEMRGGVGCEREDACSFSIAKSKKSAYSFVGHTWDSWENRGSPNLRGHIIKQHFGGLKGVDISTL